MLPPSLQKPTWKHYRTIQELRTTHTFPTVTIVLSSIHRIFLYKVILSQSNTCTKFYVLKVTDVLKCQLRSYDIIREVQSVTGTKPKQITCFNASSYTMEDTNENQGNKIMDLQKVDNIKCEIIKHSYFNQNKGLLFLRDSNINDIEEFKSYLQEQCGNASISSADFITRKSDYPEKGFDW